MANDTAAAASSPSPSSPSPSPSSAVGAEAIIDDVINKEEQHHQEEEEEEEEEDGCSICLEAFSSHDPPAVTKCKHGYHLQCILEWSQRSKECPICWQLLVLNDPSSQELLAAVASERAARSRSHIRPIQEVHEANHVAPYVDDSDFEERIIRHLAASTSRARYFHRKRRQTSSGIGPSQILPSAPFADASNLQQINSSHEEYPIADDTFSDADSPTSGTRSSASSVFPSIINTESSTDNHRPRILLNQPSSDSSQRSGSSELHTFKESLKSKFSAASARCKESIAKGTNGFKEKLLARNSTVKELSREVQREMSAGIAGVARMIDRLDLTSKRGGVPVPLSTSNLAHKGKGVQENVMTQTSSGNYVESTHNSCSDVPQFVSNTIPSHPEVSGHDSRSDVPPFVSNTIPSHPEVTVAQSRE